jgi:hypothetical protein
MARSGEPWHRGALLPIRPTGTIPRSLYQHAAPHRAAAMLFSPFSPDFEPLRTASDRPFPDDDDSR